LADCGGGRLQRGEAEYTSLAIDSTDTHYVAYMDVANAWKATVMKYADGSWQVVGTAGFSAVGWVAEVSLAIDSSGIAYCDFPENDGKVTAMKYAGGSW
jgi:hypothetical protein